MKNSQNRKDIKEWNKVEVQAMLSKKLEDKAQKPKQSKKKKTKIAK